LPEFPDGSSALFLLLAPAVLWIGMLVVLPHVEIAILSFSERIAPRVYAFGLGNYLEFLKEPRLLAHLRAHSVPVHPRDADHAGNLVSGGALYREIRGRTAKPVLFLLCLIPFWASELVRTLGWMMLLRETGVLSFLMQSVGLAGKPLEMLYNDGAVVLGLVYGGMLFMIVPLTNALESLDSSQIEAGYDLGGTNATVLRKIIIPHAMPGIVAGSIVVFMLTIGNFVTPVMLGGKNGLWFTEQIYSQFITRFNWPQGAAFGFMLLLLSTVIVWLGLRLTGQGFSETLRRT
jgi:spermidine/putrescine transport system permease protein